MDEDKRNLRRQDLFLEFYSNENSIFFFWKTEYFAVYLICRSDNVLRL